MHLSRLLIVLISISGSTNLLAQALIDPVTTTRGRGTRLEGSFTVSEIGYENDNITTTYDRKIIGASLNMGISPMIDFVGQFGLILDGKVEDTNADGDGYNLGFGVNANVYNKGRVSVNALGLFVYQKETYKSGPVKIDITNKELHLGGIADFHATKNVGIHGGLILVPMSDGEAKVGSNTNSFEREDLLNLVLGATFDFDNFTIRPQLTILGEESFTIALSSRI